MRPLSTLTIAGLGLLTAACDPDQSPPIRMLQEPPPSTPPETVAQPSVTLFGTQVIPVSATRAIAVMGFSVAANELAVQVDVRRLEDVTAVHVHAGLAGTNGPELHNLVQNPAAPDIWYLARTPVSSEMGQALDRSAVYVDIHTLKYPDGEVRAQLREDFVPKFLPVSRADSVPPGTGPDIGLAAISDVEINWGLGEPVVSVHVRLDPAILVTSVTINQGQVGQNGPIWRRLESDPLEPGHWFVEDITIGPQPSSSEVIGFYLNVTTIANPESEARGQIVPRNIFLPDSWNQFVVYYSSPLDGSTLAQWPSTVQIDFNGEPDQDAIGPETIRIHASGGDGRFSDGDEVWLHPASVSVVGNSLIADFSNASPEDDVYRIVVRGTGEDALTNIDGLVLNGRYGNEGEPSDFISIFSVDSSRGPAATLSMVQDSIFTPNCALSGCHDATSNAGLLVLTEGRSYAELVGVESVDWDDWGVILLIAAGDPAASWLPQKITESSAHPPGNLSLTNAQLQMLLEWIADGAKDN